jgi:hypothetical protein
LETAQSPAVHLREHRETATDRNGYYRFDEVSSGSYVVTVSVPAGYRPTTAIGATVTAVANVVVSVPPIGLYQPPAHLYLPLVLHQPLMRLYLPLLLRMVTLDHTLF